MGAHPFENQRLADQRSGVFQHLVDGKGIRLSRFGVRGSGSLAGIVLTSPGERNKQSGCAERRHFGTCFHVLFLLNSVYVSIGKSTGIPVKRQSPIRVKKDAVRYPHVGIGRRVKKVFDKGKLSG